MIAAICFGHGFLGVTGWVSLTPTLTREHPNPCYCLTPVYGGFDYLGLYNYVVDFFENTPGPAAKKHAQELLNWWSTWVFFRFSQWLVNSCCGRKIFPAAALHCQSNTSASCKRFKEQCAAPEEEAWAVFFFWWLSFTRCTFTRSF